MAEQTEPAAPTTAEENGATGWVAVTAAVLLGLATVATAWGAYQATRWSGVMATDFNQAILLGTDAGKLYQEGDAQYNLDNTVFVDWAVAVSEGNEEAATYLQTQLFSDELTAAVEEWSALGDQAPDSPFELDAYVITQWAEGDALEVEAQAKFESAKKANQQGDDYVLATVVFASVLFFAGMASTVRSRPITIAFLGIGTVLFIGAAGVMATMPVH